MAETSVPCPSSSTSCRSPRLASPPCILPPHLYKISSSPAPSSDSPSFFPFSSWSTVPFNAAFLCLQTERLAAISQNGTLFGVVFRSQQLAYEKFGVISSTIPAWAPWQHAAGPGLPVRAWRDRVCNWHQKSREAGPRYPFGCLGLPSFLWEGRCEDCVVKDTGVRYAACSGFLISLFLGEGGSRVQFDSDYSVGDGAPPRAAKSDSGTSSWCRLGNLGPTQRRWASCPS